MEFTYINIIKQWFKLAFLYSFLLLSTSLQAQKLNQIGYKEEGAASYYPDNRNKATTRSGEKYNMFALEGAHKLISFNTLVKVTNLENQKVAYIRINDRPYTNSRIMDFTLGAAKKLGMVGQNTSQIAIEIVAQNVYRNPINSAIQKNETTNNFKNTVSTKESKMIIESEPITLALSNKQLEAVFSPVNTYTSKGQTAYPKGFGIQIGSYTDIKVALKTAQELERLQLNHVYIQAGWNNKRRIFRVIFGKFSNKQDAQFMENNLKNSFKGIFVKQHLLLE